MSAGYEVELPDGSMYRIAPVDQAINAIRAWIDHPQPMNHQQTLALCHSLGWAPSDDDETMLTTPYAVKENDAWANVYQYDGEDVLLDVRLNLASFAPKEFKPVAKPTTRRAFIDYLTELRSLYGRGRVQKNKEDGSIRAVTWKLPNGGELRLGTTGSVLTMTFNTPEMVITGQAEEEYFRTYGNDANA